MNIRELFEGNDPILKRDYAYTIGKFAYSRMYNKNETPEDHAIKKICDIYYYTPEKVSAKQLDWVIRYATKFKITGDAKRDMLNRLNSALTSAQ